MGESDKSLVDTLRGGNAVKFRPHGNSMLPIIESGALVTISPVSEEFPNGSASHMPMPQVGDVVLCKVNGKQMLHKVTAIGSDGRYQISNNHGHINGWCTKKNIFGVLTAVEP